MEPARQWQVRPTPVLPRVLPLAPVRATDRVVLSPPLAAVRLSGAGPKPRGAADARAGGTRGHGWPRTGAIAGGGLLPVLKALLAHVLPRCHHPNQALQGTPPG